MIDGAFYLLGFCLQEMGEYERGNEAFLALVCENRYQAPLADAPEHLRVHFRNGRVARIVADGDEVDATWLEPADNGSIRAGDHRDRIPLALEDMPGLLLKTVQVH